MNLIKQIVKPGEYGTQTIKMIVKSNERGAQGEQGEKGDAATITAGQAYSVPATSGPAVMNVGTSSNAVFDFYIPRGEVEWSDIDGDIHDQPQLEPYLKKADTALQPDDINYTVMQDLSVSANGSTSVLQLDADKVNLETGATTTKNIPLTVASHDKAGVMNSATFDAVASNSAAVETILSGMVAITGLSASPSQSDLTSAWETATGRTQLTNRAQILDVDNSKYWTYYTNTELWYPATADIEGSVSTFTNSTEGTIKGSTTVGQVYAESNGTGSVNGWDTLSAQVADNTANKLGTAKLTANGGITKTTTGSGANTTVNMAITDGGVTTAKIADGNVTKAKFADRAVNSAIMTASNLIPTEDTPAAWKTLFGSTNGFYVTYYNVANEFDNQPSRYGFLETSINGSNVYQQWFTHDTIANQKICYRSGNNGGWGGSASNSGKFAEVVSRGALEAYTPGYTRTGKFIPSNSDLNTNTYCQPGSYYVTANSAASTLSNCPTTSAFRLEVYNEIGADASVAADTSHYHYLIRKLTTITGAIYIQTVVNGATTSWTFNPWKRIVDDKQTSIISTAMLQDGAVSLAKLASNAVTTAKINGLAVTADKLASSAVSSAKIASSAVTTAKIADGAVTSAKIADGNVKATQLATGAVTTDKITSAAVTAPKIDWKTLGYAYKSTVGRTITPTSSSTWYYPSGWDFSFSAVSGGVYEIDCMSVSFGISAQVNYSNSATLDVSIVSGASSLAYCWGSTIGPEQSTQTARRIVTATSTTVKVKAAVQGPASYGINVGPGLFTVKRVA